MFSKKLKTKIVVAMPNGTNNARIIKDRNLKDGSADGQQLASTPWGEYLVDGKTHRFTSEFKWGRWHHYITYYYVYNCVAPINFDQIQVEKIDDGIRPETLKPIFESWYLEESRPGGPSMTENMQRLLTFLQLGISAYTLWMVMQLTNAGA